MRAARDDDGHLLLTGLPAFCADTLARVPGWLETTDPAIRQRLMPKAYEDPNEEELWRRHGAPELESLFLSRIQIVRRDLETLAHERGERFRLRIASGHETAWLSGLNAARLTLFIARELSPQDMSRSLEEALDPKKVEALLRISFMAEVQQLLIEAGV